MDRHMRQAAAEHGGELFATDDIWYGDEDRAEPADWFVRRGWRTQSVGAADYPGRLGRPLESDQESFAALANFVVAERA
ncbi:MAG: S-adenosyl-L-methionine-dependent methyltransferase [Mycobacterium sp.]|jgi:O-methyltransferase involved in polyketide biosynthesis|nr:S-adenosyl-L-methionine-dependent methyltransferase [Mycobacterium sp.]